MDELRNCESGPHDFFFNFMVRMNMEGGRGWLVIYPVSFIFLTLLEWIFLEQKKIISPLLFLQIMSSK